MVISGHSIARDTPAEGPPGPDVNIGGRLLGITTTLIALCLLVFGLRIAIRLRSKVRLRWDDRIMTLAMICALTAWCFICVSVSYGLGRHNYYISVDRASMANKMLFFSQVPTICTAPLVKTSVAFLLKRLKPHKGWQWFLNIIVIAHVIVMLSAVIVALTQCRPISFLWDSSVEKVICMPKQATDNFWYFICAFITLTDIMFSLIPITFVYNMNLPIRERIVLCFLMALGLFASSVALIRTTTFRTYKRTGDKLWYMSDITIWNLLEGELGILAASVPYLKSTFDNVLKRFGILKINDEIQGATSVRVADYDYESELEAFRRQSQMNASSGDKLDIQVGQIIPDTDTEVSSVPSQSPGKDLGLQNNV